MPKNEPDIEDPLEMVGMLVPGDDRKMTECFVEEFMMMGYTDDALLALFRDPFYLGVNRVFQQYGEQFVRDVIAEVRHGGPVH